MADKTLATFRIEPEKWESFKALATSNDSTASAVLLQFIDNCLDAKKILSTSSTLNANYSLDNIEVLIDKRIEEILTPSLDKTEALIDKRIEESLAASLTEVRSQLEELRGKLKAR
ncbi:hypothetical protein [Nostoc sp. PA-18-2419]|uniref:hypothetical protein n=1 Tax=Nostoc sp. PA-18-2419 TaxID=2575443 RepID=UPI0011093FAC|nr:hypothetical protein [Nostoc sp. PA-18-2419]